MTHPIQLSISSPSRSYMIGCPRQDFNRATVGTRHSARRVVSRLVVTKNHHERNTRPGEYPGYGPNELATRRFRRGPQVFQAIVL
jgi:hypothetical protein